MILPRNTALLAATVLTIAGGTAETDTGIVRGSVVLPDGAMAVICADAAATDPTGAGVHTNAVCGGWTSAAGPEATATDGSVLAPDENSARLGASSSAIVVSVPAARDSTFAAEAGSLAIGESASASAIGATALGRLSNAGGGDATAIGVEANAATSAGAVAQPATDDGFSSSTVIADLGGGAAHVVPANPFGIRSVAVGSSAEAVGLDWVATGSVSGADVANASAIGRLAASSDTNPASIGFKLVVVDGGPGPTLVPPPPHTFCGEVCADLR